MSNRRRHIGNREEPTVSPCLGVFGLSLYTTERELEKEFSKFGPLEKVTVVLDGKVIMTFMFMLICDMNLLSKVVFGLMMVIYILNIYKISLFLHLVIEVQRHT